MRIAVHAFDGISMFHLSTPLIAFGEVGRLGLAPDWDTGIWSTDGGPVRGLDGVTIATADRAAARAADLVVFPSWPTDLPEPSDDLLDEIRAAHARGAMIAGLCLGAFPVVASGVLDGRTATTHWASETELAQRYPGVTVRAEGLYVDHGDVLTSAGTASALDACLHVVRTRLGSTAATALARYLVIAPHRDGDQAQYIDRPLPVAGDGPIGAATTWALAHLDAPLTVDDLAARVSMSPRHFARRFQETVGMSPAKWVLSRRLDESRRLLENTAWSIDRIARASGFASTVTFRQNFVRTYSTTPTSYRHRFTEQS
ncbi:helix-turn-helix domain-containing protein [Tsukamurella tyrosinosolvens]|uniref:GlxA family transcriptional regulator n=1 Tax=Tsukamurella tyrosinosolvens TaxID=57704 RepID=UPI001AF15F9C|nr:helix-turn-helix domain-containing protein [Tsukamurella tyrosinosolvens]QRY83625.1 helix-turn-helix domain-containing protein [Tsukamurella tyrosinosolvens]